MFESSYGDGLRTGIKEGKAIGIQEGKAIGIQEGKSLGIQEGAHAKALAIARNLLGTLDDVSIANITGLPVDEVSTLRLMP